VFKSVEVTLMNMALGKQSQQLVPALISFFECERQCYIP